MVIQLHISLPPSDCAIAFGRLEDKGASLASSGSTHRYAGSRTRPGEPKPAFIVPSKKLSSDGRVGGVVPLLQDFRSQIMHRGGATS